MNQSLPDITIDETTARGTNICNLNITDPDIDTKLNFGILSGNFQNAFTFTFLSSNSDNSTRTSFEAVGQLVVVGPLSYEARHTYRLVLLVSDSYNTQLINVTVQLRPKNTKAPEFQRTGDSMIYHFVVDELSDAPVFEGRCVGVSFFELSLADTLNVVFSRLKRSIVIFHRHRSTTRSITRITGST